MDPKIPVVMPLVWSVTNLTTQSAETCEISPSNRSENDRDLPVVNLAYMRPRASPPAKFGSFDQQGDVDATLAIGEADGARAFTTYAWRSFSA